jgi:hypothetical protein
MADGLPASSAANSCNSLSFWAVAPLGPPLPPRAFGVLLPPAAYWLTASLACRGGSDRSASPESIDVTSGS